MPDPAAKPPAAPSETEANLQRALARAVAGDVEQSLQRAVEEAIAEHLEENLQQALADAAEEFAPRPPAPPEPSAPPEEPAARPPAPTSPEVVALPPAPPDPEPAPTTEPQAGVDLSTALSSIAAQAGTDALAADTVVRPYHLRETSAVLGVFAGLMLLLDADGLLTWARRMEVGTAQSAWLALVTPLQQGLDAVGFTKPRRALVAAAEALSRAAGTGGDPLLAEAWTAEPADDRSFDTEPSTDWVPLPTPSEPVRAAEEAPSATGVLLIGDSMFVGNLGAAVTNALGADEKLRVVDAYQTATGLSRPDVFDWLHVAPALLDRERPGLVVCSFGANDAQPIRQGKKLLPFGSPAWETAYRQRVKAMMKGLTSGGARVLWLGLPPMRDPALSRRVAHLNRLFAQIARDVPGTDFLEVGMLLSNADGSYTTFVHDGRTLVRMRMDDGVHYSPAGARTVSRWIVDWVYERLPRQKRAGRLQE